VHNVSADFFFVTSFTLDSLPSHLGLNTVSIRKDRKIKIKSNRKNMLYIFNRALSSLIKYAHERRGTRDNKIGGILQWRTGTGASQN
jgi:hypothetical protein